MRRTASHRGSEGCGLEDRGDVRVECCSGSRLHRDSSNRFGLSIPIDNCPGVPFSSLHDPVIVAPAEEYEVQPHGFVSMIVCTSVANEVRSAIGAASVLTADICCPLYKICHCSMFPCRCLMRLRSILERDLYRILKEGETEEGGGWNWGMGGRDCTCDGGVRLFRVLIFRLF